MDEAIRIHGRLAGGVAHVRILMPHPMETGMRLGEGGQLLPAHHITEVTVTLGARTVFAARMSIAVSRDPLIQFRFTGAEPGQQLRVAWTDNRGASRSATATIA